MQRSRQLRVVWFSIVAAITLYGAVAGGRIVLGLVRARAVTQAHTERLPGGRTVEALIGSRMSGDYVVLKYRAQVAVENEAASEDELLAVWKQLSRTPEVGQADAVTIAAVSTRPRIFWFGGLPTVAIEDRSVTLRRRPDGWDDFPTETATTRIYLVPPISLW